METRRRSRRIYYNHPHYVNTSITGVVTSAGDPIFGAQVTVDRDNPGWRIRRKAKRSAEKRGIDWTAKPISKLDLGGPFSTKTSFYTPVSLFNGTVYGKSQLGGRSTQVRNYYDLGPSRARWDTSATNLVASDSSFLDALGTIAIARVNPLKPISDNVITLAELIREGIPKQIGSSLLKTRLKDARKLGDEYLNVAFGWSPLVKSVLDTAKAIDRQEFIISQLYRDSGRTIRRRYQFPKEENVTIVNMGATLPYPTVSSNFLSSGTGSFPMLRETKTVTDRWFSGGFTYHMPPLRDGLLDDLRRAKLEARKLYGARVDPEVLWNLMPWSWAIDWFTSAGDVLTNLSSFTSGGLVMRYGYMMETKTITVTDTMHVPIVGHGSVRLCHSYGHTIKTRRRATPYGFGLNFDGFTPYQWGIIGALGISKIPKGLG